MNRGLFALFCMATAFVAGCAAPARRTSDTSTSARPCVAPAKSMAGERIRAEALRTRVYSSGSNYNVRTELRFEGDGRFSRWIDGVSTPIDCGTVEWRDGEVRLVLNPRESSPDVPSTEVLYPVYYDGSMYLILDQFRESFSRSVGLGLPPSFYTYFGPAGRQRPEFTSMPEAPQHIAQRIRYWQEHGPPAN